MGAISILPRLLSSRRLLGRALLPPQILLPARADKAGLVQGPRSRDAGAALQRDGQQLCSLSSPSQLPHACVHACPCACVYAHVCVYISLCAYVSVCICMYLCMYMCVCLCVPVCICVCVCMYMCLCLCVDMCISVCTQGLNPHLIHLLHCRQVLYPWATW